MCTILITVSGGFIVEMRGVGLFKTNISYTQL